MMRLLSRAYYPLFVSLEQRVCLVVGGGPVAERKIRGIIQYGGTVRLIAEALTPWLHTQCDYGTVALVGKAYTSDHLQDVDLVFAATNDLALNRRIAQDATRCRLWCNMVTEPERGSFMVPSIFQRGSLTIAISTGGASPAMAVRIRRKLEREFGTEWMVLLELMALLRGVIQEKGLDTQQNQNIYRKIADLPLLEWIQAGDKVALKDAIAEICYPWLTRMELEHIWDTAWKQYSS